MFLNSIFMRPSEVQAPTTNVCLTGDFQVMPTDAPSRVTRQLNRTIRLAVTTRAKWS